MHWSGAIVMFALCAVVAAAPQPRVSYTALSDAARASGQTEHYAGVPVSRHEVESGDYRLTVEVPETMRAYDAVPVRYRLEQPAGARRAAVVLVAHEEAARAQGHDLFDMAVPGDLAVQIEYLGSVSADITHDTYVPLERPDSPVSPFPPLRRDAQVRSGTVRAAEAMWFQFRVTNTGDTVLSPEGMGTTFGYPRITRLDETGKELWSAGTINQYERHLDYVYPGESFTLWANFWCPELGDKNGGLEPGRYRIDFSMLYKYWQEYSWGLNIWHGKDFALLQVPIEVTADGGESPVETSFSITDPSEKMPGIYETFEEFMTTLRVFEPADAPAVQEGVLYVQPAPWTDHIAIKLVLTDPKALAMVRVPVTVTGETLELAHCPGNVMVIEGEDGREDPVILAMAMPGMRSGIQLGPWPEDHMRDQIQELKALGANLIANTSGDWWIPEVSGHKRAGLLAGQYKYWYDVLMREAGMKTLGWSVYPPQGIQWYQHGASLIDHPFEVSRTVSSYGGAGVDLGDPMVPEMIAAWAKFHHTRWGDLWFTTKDGRVPVDIEDTWGWLRDDINVRYSAGPLAIARFRAWVGAKYGTIGAVNEAWGSDFDGFDTIDPEADQGTEGDDIATHGPVYNIPEHPFHDWSPATEDWDRFRTELRMDIYERANALMRETIPGAELALRTEGANLIVPGDRQSDSMHLRHVWFSQRRNAMVHDIVRDRDVLHFYSDYTTLPYSEPEWRTAMEKMTADGIIPMFLPTFNRMRDILLNPHYGREYQTHYGLDSPSKGMMVMPLTAAYPYWKATYEAGGAPGIIWSDYLCDGYATVTQKREMRLLRDAMNRMLDRVAASE
jgi:hypothetical protein